jgi:COP9 signalosome complex subunit 7
MELGSHLASKSEPFLLISKSAKGAAAAKLILDAISSQGVYFFAELLDAPNIKEVRRQNGPYTYPNHLMWHF